MASELPIRGAYLATINYLKAERAPLLHELDIDNYRLELRASPEKIFFLLYLPNGFVLLSLLLAASIGAAEDVQVERRKEATTLRYQTGMGTFSIQTQLEISSGLLYPPDELHI